MNSFYQAIHSFSEEIDFQMTKVGISVRTDVHSFNMHDRRDQSENICLHDDNTRNNYEILMHHSS